ncbi:MAG: retroviral-like aspartic protease family protein [Chloroflexota bacterium]
MTNLQYSRDYDNVYYPAMPVVDIVLVNPNSGEKSHSFTAMVDSGADGSIIPVRMLEFSELDEARKIRMVGVGGVSRIMDRYWVSIEIGEIMIWGIQAMADKSNSEAIIGRDVLNQLVVTLNGLSETIEIIV